MHILVSIRSLQKDEEDHENHFSSLKGKEEEVAQHVLTNVRVHHYRLDDALSAHRERKSSIFSFSMGMSHLCRVTLFAASEKRKEEETQKGVVGFFFFHE